MGIPESFFRKASMVCNPEVTFSKDKVVIQKLVG